MSARGAFTLILHGHLPYVPYVQVRLHEFTSNTLIPLLQMLDKLNEDRVAFLLTISLSPLLIEQLNRPTTPAGLNAYLDERIAAARHDRDFFNRNRLTARDGGHETADPHLAYLAEWHATRLESIKTAFNERFGHDIVGAFRDFQETGLIELIASPVTHAYLPLLKQDTSITRQVRLGIEHYQQVFDRQPTGMWLPELGYRPGLEALLANEDIRVFVCESHTLTGGPPTGVAAGDSRGPYGDVRRRFALVQQASAPTRDTSTLQPYWADTAGRIATIARDDRTTMQVWGEAVGYPGDVDYCESQRRSGTSGLPYWRITGHGIDLSEKDYYHPEWAGYKVDQHAEHFAHLVGDMTRGYHAATGLAGVIAPVFDMRLFGHWWLEGIDWLAQTFRHLANTPQIELTTISRYIDDHPPAAHVDLDEGSWGIGGRHFLVDNPKTGWLWARLDAAEDRLAQVSHEQLSGEQREVFDQAVRQLLLLQASDWATMITTGQAETYAIHQFNVHDVALDRLMSTLEAGQADDRQGNSHLEGRDIFPIFAGINVS